jgi:hypothetical protein
MIMVCGKKKRQFDGEGVLLGVEQKILRICQ